MNSLKSILEALRKFGKDVSGAVTVEFVIIMPALMWAYGASYVYFDGYRQSAQNLKAAYTIGDMISRETNAITDAYIDSMYSIAQLLTRARNPMSLRITVIRWDEEDDRYYLDWSEPRGSVVALTEDNLLEIADKLPVMPDNERVILVETWNEWQGVFNTSLGTVPLDNFVFTSPRFGTQVLHEDML